MRIAIIGKGGSGKTTITSLLSTYLKEKYERLLIVDADLNSHLDETLKVEYDKTPIGDLFEEIKDYFYHNRKDIEKKEMIGTTPPNKDSQFVYLNENDKFIQKYFIKKDNIFFTKVGSYSKEDIGSNCYHTKLNSLEIFLHHFLDNKEDISLIDSTAGIDILGTSLYMSYDYLFFVVEPTLKSVRVFNDFYEKIKDEKINLPNIAIIGNKIFDNQDKEFIKNNIKSADSFFFVNQSQLFRKIEQGQNLQLLEIVKENQDTFDNIYEYINLNYKKNWEKYYLNLETLHKKICQNWYNDYYSKDISQIDKEGFSYLNYLKENEG